MPANRFEIDTIVAVATPPGRAALGIVRLSGHLCEEILKKIFLPKRPLSHLKSHRLYYGHIVCPKTKQIIDEVMLALMRKPHSYTGEDVLEIYAHGNPLILNKILEACLACGARLAEPGEFTKRAFLNGRLDLTQAEAVLNVINASSESELKIAQSQLQGYLKNQINKIKKVLIDFKAHLEVAIDFPEEDVEIVPPEVWQKRLKEEVLLPLNALLKDYERGHFFREGALMAIVGRPNVGKSSLLNRLLKRERAIVTDLPGTTRDIIEESLNIKGLTIRIADTAGIRKAQDEIEALGIKLAQQKLTEADIVLWVLDLSQPFQPEDGDIYEQIKNKRVILVLNKKDLPRKLILKQAFKHLPQIEISALTGENIDRLEGLIFDVLTQGQTQVPSFVPSLRHKQALSQAYGAIKRCLEAIEQGLPPVFLSVEVQQALDALGEIIGQTTPEEVLNTIFNQFCIGK